jgi:hypothetical protein
MKVVLIALCALVVFDAVAWKGAYRTTIVRETKHAAYFVTKQSWTWMN